MEVTFFAPRRRRSMMSPRSGRCSSRLPRGMAPQRTLQRPSWGSGSSSMYSCSWGATSQPGAAGGGPARARPVARAAADAGAPAGAHRHGCPRAMCPGSPRARVSGMSVVVPARRADSMSHQGGRLGAGTRRARRRPTRRPEVPAADAHPHRRRAQSRGARRARGVVPGAPAPPRPPTPAAAPLVTGCPARPRRQRITPSAILASALARPASLRTGSGRRRVARRRRQVCGGRPARHRRSATTGAGAPPRGTQEAC